MEALLIHSQDREQLLADFAEAIRTGPDRPFVVVLSYKLPAQDVAAVHAFMQALPSSKGQGEDLTTSSGGSMAFHGIPHDVSEAGGVGAAAATPILVSGIKSGDRLLAVVKHRVGPGGEAVGLDCSDFTVSTGAIQSASVSTEGYGVHVAWTTPS